MARPPKRPLRGSAGAGGQGRGQAPASGAGAGGRGRAPASGAGAGLAMRGADEILLGDGKDLALHPDEELEIKDDDDVRDDAAGLFGIDLSDGTQPIDLDGDDDVEPSTDTHCTSTTSGINDLTMGASV